MPYNFETTFTQPLLAQLDAGTIKGAEDWATAITDCYAKTVALGLPQGVPPTLPAPGLNPITPPPYPIGAVGITNNPKEEVFKQTIKAYFLAKEIGNDKAALKGLIQTLTQLIAKIKVRRTEVLDLVQNIKTLSKELANIPQYIEEMVASVKEIVAEDIKKVKDLLELFANLEEELKEVITPQELRRIFSKEFQLLNMLKNFKIDNFESLMQLSEFSLKLKDTVDGLKREAGISVVGVAGEGERMAFVKEYMKGKIADILLSIEQISAIVVDPPNFLNYVNKLRKKSPKFNRVYQVVSKLDAIERYVKPQIEKLKKLKDQKIKQIKDYIEPKIDEIRKKVDEKVQEIFLKKKEGQKDNLYLKTKKRVDEFKKTHGEKIKKSKKEITIIQQAIKKSVEIVRKIDLLVKSLEEEFESIKSDLILFKQSIANGSAFEGYADISKDFKKQLAERAQQPLIPTPQNILPIDPTKPLTLDQMRANARPGEFVQGYERSIDSPLDLERSRELRKQANKDAEGVVATQEEVYEYMSNVGLGDLSNTAFRVITDTKVNIGMFKKFFEKKKSLYHAYLEEIQALRDDIEELLDIIQSIVENGGLIGSAAAWAKNGAKSLTKKASNLKVVRFVIKKGASLKQLFEEIITRIKPWIAKAESWARRLLKQVKDYVKEKAEKFEKEIEWFLLNLIPLGSDKKDFETKQLEIQAKKLRIEYYKKQIRYYQKLGTAIGKTVKGSSALSKNLFIEGKYLLSANEKAIRDVVDGIYDYKATRANNDASVISGLDADRASFISKMDDLIVIEMLILGLIEFFKVVTNSKDYIEDWNQFIESLKDSPAFVIDALKALGEVYNNPPKNPLEIKKLIEDTLNTSNIMRAFEEVPVINGLIALEKKHLGRVKEMLKTLTDSKLKDTVNRVTNGRVKSKRLYDALKEVSDVVNSKTSFIKFLLGELKKQLDNLALFIRKEVNKLIDEAKQYIKAKLEKIQEQYDEQLEKIKERAVNVDAVVMTTVFGIAAQLYWAGATWTGPTATSHTTFTVGLFAPEIKGLPKDGASGLVKEMAKGFETQLQTMTGLVIPPANTGIPPIPFTGYK